MSALHRFALLVITIAAGLGSWACAPFESMPPVLGPPRWQLTVSPEEPAAGIMAEVTLRRLSTDGKYRPFALAMPVPAVYAREVDRGTVVRAIERNIDHRGAWMFDLAFPEPGRWQVMFVSSAPASFGEVSNTPVIWPAPPAPAPAVVRDAVGDTSLSLVLQVIPDRGPILWFLRTHILEAIGVAVILVASVVSYLVQQRRAAAAAARS